MSDLDSEERHKVFAEAYQPNRSQGLKRSEMIQKIADALENIMYDNRTFHWQEADICAEAALKSCEQEGMLPPLKGKMVSDQFGNANFTNAIHAWEPEE